METNQFDPVEDYVRNATLMESDMSVEAIMAIAANVIVLLGIGAGLVWRLAIYSSRITALEKDVGKLDKTIGSLEDTISQLKLQLERVWDFQLRGGSAE